MDIRLIILINCLIYLTIFFAFFEYGSNNPNLRSSASTKYLFPPSVTDPIYNSAEEFVAYMRVKTLYEEVPFSAQDEKIFKEQAYECGKNLELAAFEKVEVGMLKNFLQSPEDHQDFFKDLTINCKCWRALIPQYLMNEYDLEEKDVAKLKSFITKILADHFWHAYYLHKNPNTVYSIEETTQISSIADKNFENFEELNWEK